MQRKDDQYWQRIRFDKKSNWAAGMTAIAAILTATSVTMILVPGSQYEARSNILYWGIFIPVVWWLVGLSRFEPWPVRIWRPALIVLCITKISCLWIVFRGPYSVGIESFTTAVVLISAAAAFFLYRGSLIDREGPAR